MASRVEARRIAEQGRNAVLSESVARAIQAQPDSEAAPRGSSTVSDSELTKFLLGCHAYCWQSILFINAIVAVSSCRHQISELSEIEPYFRIFIPVDIALYISYFIWLFIMCCTMNEENKWLHIKLSESISFLAYLNAQVAFFFSFNDSIDPWKIRCDENESAFKWIQSMMYLRMPFWWIVLFFVAACCPCICLMLCIKGE